ncbi:MAG TPA: hypothetical protein V6D17_03905 [Candidatus Obscuribacterales bacterium]
MMPSSVAGTSALSIKQADDYCLPPSCTVLSDVNCGDERRIAYKKNTSTFVALRIFNNGVCEETRETRSRLLRTTRRYRIYCPPGLSGIQWQVQLVRVGNSKDGQSTYHAIARQYGSQPFRLLVEHFGEFIVDCPQWQQEAIEDVSEIVARSACLRFRTLEYNSEPHYLKTMSTLEVRCCPFQSSTDKNMPGPKMCDAPSLNVEETHFSSAADTKGTVRKCAAHSAKLLAPWVIARFEKSLTMLFGET